MLIPYRVKNPTKNFPVATVAIIAINCLVYMFTTNNLLQIKESVVNSYAFGLGASPIFNFFSAIFLHADPFHLIGNMLFFWVFGPPVEDRLGIPRYIGLYLITGFAGDILQALFDQIIFGHPQLGIGASGCIMGIVGAYWYLFSWSTVCVFYWFGLIFHGVWEVAAIWMIALYVFIDIAEGVFSGALKGAGGVANFAHVGGAVAGMFLCIAMRAKRDSEAMSEAKAIHADMGDLSSLPVHALESMLEEDKGNPELIRAAIQPAMRMGRESMIHTAMRDAGLSLIDKDPGLVVHYLVDLHGDPTLYQPMHLLRLAGILERANDPSQALLVYRYIVNTYPSVPDAETAFYRMAHCYWNTLHNGQSARACLQEMATRFPNGPMFQFGKTLWNQIK